MKRFLLDTSAILTLRDDEAGAERVAEVLGLAISGKAKCYGCFMTLMEVYYRVWRDEDKDAGQRAYQQCLALPIEWMSPFTVANTTLPSVNFSDSGRCVFT